MAGAEGRAVQSPGSEGDLAEGNMKCLLFAGCCALLACSPAGQPTYSIGPDAGLEAGTDGGADGSPATAAMPRVSGGVPAFASSTNFGAGPANANDDNPSSAWEPS